MMRNNMKEMTGKVKRSACRIFTRKSEGLDGILVTVGLCIIALLLCVVMKDSLTTFINTIVGNLTAKAQSILGV